MTVATGELSDLDADRTGLVPTHAYAVLNVRNINGERLVTTKKSLVSFTLERKLFRA